MITDDLPIAICIKGIHKFVDSMNNTYLINKVNTGNYKEYYQFLSLTIIEPLNQKFGVDIYLSTYNSDEKDNIINMFKPKNYVFTEFNITDTTWKAQLKHFKNLINILKNSKKKYLFVLFTRFDFTSYINILNYNINLDTFNFIYKHSGTNTNSDDNLIIVPFNQLLIFEKIIDHLIITNQITHSINVNYEKITGNKCNYLGCNHDMDIRQNNDNLKYFKNILFNMEPSPINYPCSDDIIQNFRNICFKRWKELNPNSKLEILTN